MLWNLGEIMYLQAFFLEDFPDASQHFEDYILPLLFTAEMRPNRLVVKLLDKHVDEAVKNARAIEKSIQGFLLF